MKPGILKFLSALAYVLFAFSVCALYMQFFPKEYHQDDGSRAWIVSGTGKKVVYAAVSCGLLVLATWLKKLAQRKAGAEKDKKP